MEGRVAFPSPLLWNHQFPGSCACELCSMPFSGPPGMEEEEMLTGAYCCFLSCLSLLSPLRQWAEASGLQTCSSLYLCQEQPSSKVKLQLFPCPLTQTEQPGEGNRGISCGNKVSRWQGKKQVISICALLSARGCHAHHSAHLALLRLPALPYCCAGASLMQLNDKLWFSSAVWSLFRNVLGMLCPVASSSVSVPGTWYLGLCTVCGL